MARVAVGFLDAEAGMSTRARDLDRDRLRRRQGGAQARVLRPVGERGNAGGVVNGWRCERCNAIAWVGHRCPPPEDTAA